MHRLRIGTVLIPAIALSVAACSTVQYRADYDRQAQFVEYQTYDFMLPTEAEQEQLARISPFLERRLERALDRELTERGYSRSTNGSPDMWVSAYPVVPDMDGGSSGGPASFGAAPVRSSGVAVSVGFAVAPGGFGFGPAPYGYGVGPYGMRRFSPYPYFGYPAFGFAPSFGIGYYSMGGYGMAPSGYGGLPLAASASGNTPGTLAVDVTDARSDVLVWRGWAEGALFEPVTAEELAEFVEEVVAKIMRGFPPPQS